MTDGQDPAWGRGLPDLKDIDLYGGQEVRRWSPPPDPDPPQPARTTEFPEPTFTRLRKLLAEEPEWGAAVVPPIQPEFTEWIALEGLPVISMARLPDNGLSVSRYGLVCPTGELGRYQVQLAFRLTETSWVLGPPRPRMNIRAALELVARLVAESA